MTQSDANCSLRPNSLIIKENTGNFLDFGATGPTWQLKKPAGSVVFLKIPYSSDQGIS